MNLVDGEGEFTWPNGGRHQSIYTFQITLAFYLITFNALQMWARYFMNLLDGEGEFTWPDGDRNPSICMFQITLTLYRITFNALQICGRDPDEPIGW
jgi:hypothetical protein